MVTRGGGAHDGRGAQQRPWTRLHGNGIRQGMQPRLDGVDVWPGRVRVSAARRRTGLGRYGSAIRRAAGAVSLCRWLDGAPDCACWVVVLVGTAPLSQIERRGLSGGWILAICVQLCRRAKQVGALPLAVDGVEVGLIFFVCDPLFSEIFLCVRICK